jgi:hypothetical protein
VPSGLWISPALDTSAPTTLPMRANYGYSGRERLLSTLSAELKARVIIRQDYNDFKYSIRAARSGSLRFRFNGSW